MIEVTFQVDVNQLALTKRYLAEASMLLEAFKVGIQQRMQCLMLMEMESGHSQR